MRIRYIYFAAEDRFFAVVHFLAVHGIPLYPLVDALEEKEIHSFAAALAAAAVLLAALGLLLGQV